MLSALCYEYKVLRRARYWDLHRHLLQECGRRGTDGYPWSSKVVESRVMEREYMAHLIDHWVRPEHALAFISWLTVDRGL